MKSLLQLLVLLLLAVSVYSALSPIIIIPGIVGSQLWARLRMRSTSSWLCPRYRYKYQVWFNLNLATTPGYDECFRDYIKLKYDEATGEYHDNDGVQMSVPGFGDTETVEFIRSKGLIKIPYFHFFVKYFVKRGYTRGVNLRGAPYDWRYAPDGHTRNGYYKALYDLIEDTYTRNGNTPVTLVVHSMGGPVTTYFLNKYVQSDEWKASRIKQFVSLAGAFGGSTLAVPLLTSGFDIAFVDPLVLREAVRTFPSVVFMLPSPKLWSNEEVLVRRPSRSYTAHDYEALFADMKNENGLRILDEVKDLISDFPPPGVTHYCFYGTRVPTIAKFEYGLLEFPDEQPRMSFEDGDGIVNTRSMESCSLFKDKQEQPVVIKSYPFVDHITILFRKRILDAIAELVQD